ncbi:MAG: hypothetical protein V1712_02510 [Patescibacteria group bacterium]
MKNIFKAKLLTALVLGLGISLVAPSAVLAADVNYDADASVTIGSATYTIVSGSAATSVVVGTTTVTVVVPVSSSFVFKSSDRYRLSTDTGISEQCSISGNQITVTGAATVVITPDATTVCSYDSGGGGGGGGGGSTVTTVDVTPPTNTSVSINAAATVTNTIDVTLTLGAVGASDMIIGNASDFVGSSWVTFSTSKAWALTSGNGVKTVYAKFRDAANNISAVVSDTITLDTSAVITEPAPETPATTPEEQEEERAAQVEQILDEAGSVSTSSAEAMAQNAGTTRNLALEQQYSSTIVEKVVPVGTAAEIRNQIVSFVTYGTSTTQVLGAGERAGVVNSFRAAFGKVPTTEVDWADVIKIANGRWPGTLNTQREATVTATFKKIYLRNAVRANAHDDAAITVMAYGLRPLPRNLNSEKVAIKTFKALFGTNPVSATDWDTVRAIAYSGATR